MNQRKNHFLTICPYCYYGQVFHPVIANAKGEKFEMQLHDCYICGKTFDPYKHIIKDEQQ